VVVVLMWGGDGALRRLRPRFWIEFGCANACLMLGVVTLTWRDWIELVLHVDPDRSSGMLEWSLVGVFAVLAVTLTAVACREARHRYALGD
jgi:hypothetical protein